MEVIRLHHPPQPASGNEGKEGLQFGAHANCEAAMKATNVIRTLPGLAILAILVAAFALNLTAVAQSNTSVQAHQCPVGHTWVNTSWGSACVTNETAPPVATEPQHQAIALPGSPEFEARLAALIQEKAKVKVWEKNQKKQAKKQQRNQLSPEQAAILGYLYSRPSYTPYMLPMPQAPQAGTYSVPNNQIHCTTHTFGVTANTDCY
jgi:hypothetical protein